MSGPNESSPTESKNYFVDEAGDPTLFGARGNVLIGSLGCSRFFMLGVADISAPLDLAKQLDALRSEMLADPYFKDVPSMQKARGRTALFFHAKDDPAEVRREVLRLLKDYPLRFSAIVHDKFKVLEYVRARNERESAYHYNPNELYDFMVRRLFKERLHKHREYRITFARRGGSDRTDALTKALQRARERFATAKGIRLDARIEVIPSSPVREVALQAVDYYLWALQRAFERHEDRFLSLLWTNVSLVIDADDTRNAEYGTYYTRSKQLTASELKEAEGYRSKPPK